MVGPVKGKPGKFGYMCLFCRSYRCNRCRGSKLKKVRSRIAQIASEKQLNRMATLTLDRKRIPRDVRSDRYIRECWRKMRVLLGRKFGASLDFVGVLEFQKNGMAHLHILLGRYVPQAWLSEAWQSIGGGQIVDIRFVDIYRVTSYLVCYLSGKKVEHTLSLLPLRARIFTTSRSIILWGKKKSSGWWLCRVDLSELREVVPFVSMERYEAIEDLKPFGLELLSYFEGPPVREAMGNRDAIAMLKAAIPIWKAEAL